MKKILGYFLVALPFVSLLIFIGFFTTWWTSLGGQFLFSPFPWD